jgi:hypothetical protein
VARAETTPYKTADNIDSICHSSLDLEISQLHKEAGLMPAEDRFYCEQSLQRILHSSLSNKRRWLHRVKLSRARKASQELMQPRITTFFPVQEPSSTQDYRHLRPIPSPALSPPHTNTTQTVMTQVFSERSPNPPILAPRTTTTQQLPTEVFEGTCIQYYARIIKSLAAAYSGPLTARAGYHAAPC